MPSRDQMLSRATAALKARVTNLEVPWSSQGWMEQGLGARAKRSRTAERPGKAPPLAARLPRRFARSQRRSASGHNPSQPSTVGRRGEDHGAPAPPPPPRPRRPWPLWPWGRRAATRSLPPGRLAGSPLPLVLNGRTADRRCSYRWFLPFWSRRHGVCSFRDGLYSRSWAAAATVTALVFRE